MRDGRRGRERERGRSNFGKEDEEKKTGKIERTQMKEEGNINGYFVSE